MKLRIRHIFNKVAYLEFHRLVKNIQNTNASTEHKERKKKESIVDLSRYLEKIIRVKFAGGREVSGILKGYDPLVNLVLDNTTEYLRDPDDPFKLTTETRHLGLVVCRGTAVILICPMDGMESIPNPFISHE
ncbi:hypothetical protein PGB90_008962 [Kerria lacca]